MEKGIARHSMIKATLAAFFLCALIVPAGADSPAPNVAYVAKSDNELFKVEFAPAVDFGLQGEGKVYDVSHGGERLLYTVSWYARDVKISNDGHVLVRPGPWASDIEKLSDLALAFYYDGKQRKSYQVSDLLKDKESVDRSVSHYMWLAEKSAEARGFSTNGKRYTIVLTDKTVYEFSTLDGSILATRQDPTARSQREISKEGEFNAAEAANAYIAKESKLQAFLAFFQITRQYAKRGHIYGVTLEGEQWWANLIPLKPELSRTKVEIAFAIDSKLDRVQVGLTPQQLEGALTEIKAVPFVQQFLGQDSRNGVRLRAAGDNLHWDSDEVARVIKAFPADLRTAPLKDWVYFIIDSREGCIAIYHPLHKDLFILDSNPANFSQWKKRGEELKMAWKSGVDQYGVLSCKGELVSAFAVTREPLK